MYPVKGCVGCVFRQPLELNRSRFTMAVFHYNAFRYVSLLGVGVVVVVAVKTEDDICVLFDRAGFT